MKWRIKQYWKFDKQINMFQLQIQVHYPSLIIISAQVHVFVRAFVSIFAYTKIWINLN